MKNYLQILYLGVSGNQFRSVSLLSYRKKLEYWNILPTRTTWCQFHTRGTKLSKRRANDSAVRCAGPVVH